MKKRMAGALMLLLLLSACGGPAAEKTAGADFLIPFAATVWRDESGHETACLHGLVTARGEVVVDPEFSTACYLESYGDWGHVISRPNVLLLGKIFTGEEGQPIEQYALCAGDGSWRTDFLYKEEPELHVSCDWGIPLLNQEGELVFLDPKSGRELRVLDLAAQMGEGDFSVDALAVDPGSGWVCVNPCRWTEEGEYVSKPLLYDPEGERIPLPPEVVWVGGCENGLALAEIVQAGGEFTSHRRGYLDVTTGEWAIEPVYLKAGPFEDSRAFVSDEYGAYMINTAGEVLALVEDHTFHHGDYWYVVGELIYEIVSVLDRDMAPVDSPLVGAPAPSYLEDGWICAEVDYEWILARGAETVRFPVLEEFPYRLGQPIYAKGDRVVLKVRIPSGDPDTKETAYITLTDLEGNIITRLEGYDAAVRTDPVTGEGYVEIHRYADRERLVDLYDLNGKLLFAGENRAFGSLMGGLIYISEEGRTTLTDREGKVIFRWPIDSSQD